MAIAGHAVKLCLAAFVVPFVFVFGPFINVINWTSNAILRVFGLPADAIHSVTNPIERLTGALHLYGGDFFAPGRSEWDPETLREQPWDIAAAQEKFRRAEERFNAIPQPAR